MSTTSEWSRRVFKQKIVLTVLMLLLAGAVVYIYYPYQYIYALAWMDVELVFVVRDADTGLPIPNALIEIESENWKGGEKEPQHAKLYTDTEGRASYFKENVSCEDIIRTLRPTRTSYDLTWCIFAITGKGYVATEWEWLASSNYKLIWRLHSTSGNRFCRFEVTIPLNRIK